MKAESIIFDLDGTLWDSSENVAAAWDEIAAADENGRNITVEDVRGIMGMTMDTIADKLFGELDKAARMELLGRCMENENPYIAEHGGKIYDRLEQTLELLAKDHRLFIVSNCQCGYVEAFLKYSGFSKYFTDHLCWGDTLKPKSETIRQLMEKNNCTNAVYVGDTQGDCNAADGAQIPFIHASYGFGEISTPEKISAVISSPWELTEIFC